MYQHISEFQQVMKENGVDLSVLRLPENLALFTQYWSRNGYSYLMIPANGEPSVLVPIVEEADTAAAGLTNVFSFNDIDMAAGDPDVKTLEVFADLAAKYNISANSMIGLELDYDNLAPCFCSGKVTLVGAKTKKMVANGFGCDNFVPVKGLIKDVMAIKNADDIEKLKIVNSLVSEAMDYFEKLVDVPGITEIEIVTEVEKFVRVKAPGFHGARVSRAWGQLSTGLKGEVASCDGVISDARQLEKGDCCLFELGACVDGYWADVSRSAVVGGATGKAKEMMELIEKSFQAGVAAVRIGATGRDIDAATRKVMEDAGYGQYYLHCAGHGVGFSYHESIPELNPSSDDVLKENMVIAIEPGLYVPGVGGLRKEVNVLVTKNGGQLLGW